MDDGLARLLERRVERSPSAPVDVETVAQWCAVFGSDWLDGDGGADTVVPMLMYPTFVRPTSPASDAVTGVALHDELKAHLDLPVAIAVGYDLDLVGSVRPGDRLVAVERVASVGELRSSPLGEGRDWVIEVATSTTTGAPVGVERFRMFGYRVVTDRSTPRATASAAGAGADTGPERLGSLTIDVALVVRAASANRVWAPAHHDPEAARAAGLPDIILDTSSQVALLTGAAQRRRAGATVRSVELSMRRPVVPGVEVLLSGAADGDRTSVTASVDGAVVSRSVVVFAT